VLKEISWHDYLGARIMVEAIADYAPSRMDDATRAGLKELQSTVDKYEKQFLPDVTDEEHNSAKETIQALWLQAWGNPLTGRDKEVLKAKESIVTRFNRRQRT